MEIHADGTILDYGIYSSRTSWRANNMVEGTAAPGLVQVLDYHETARQMSHYCNTIGRNLADAKAVIAQLPTDWELPGFETDASLLSLTDLCRRTTIATDRPCGKAEEAQTAPRKGRAGKMGERATSADRAAQIAVHNPKYDVTFSAVQVQRQGQPLIPVT